MARYNGEANSLQRTQKLYTDSFTFTRRTWHFLSRAELAATWLLIF